MNIWEVIGVITALLTLAGSVLFHLFKTTWWMATLTATLTNLNTSVDEVRKTMARYETLRYTTEDAIRDFALRDKQLEAMWRRVDELKDKKGV